MQISTIFLPLVFLAGALASCQSSPVKNETEPKSIQQDYSLALEAIFGMGLRLQAVLDTSDKGNFVVSPVSTVAILAQLMMGAKGKFRDQLYELLSLPKTQEIANITHFNKNKKENYCLPYGRFHLQLSGLLKKLKRRNAGEQFILNLDNAVFYNENIELRSDFKKLMNDYYDAELIPLDFYNDTSKIINDWASKHTNGLISSAVNSQLSPTTASIFLNSIYFRAEWESKFSDELNMIDSFNVDATTTVNTTYMLSYLSGIPFYQAKRFKLVCLPYLNRELGMYIILPNDDHEFKHDIKKFVQNVDLQDVLDGIEHLKDRDVVVKIPKLSLSNTLRLLEPLQKFSALRQTVATEPPAIKSRDSIDEIKNRIDVYKNFTPPAEHELYLSGAAKEVNLKVSDIVQQMVFSINENGTEAAVVTSSIIDYIGGSKSFVLNRPFSFFINHQATNATIFWGTISDPSRS